VTQSPSPFRTGLTFRCPRCGRGALFRGYLDVAPSCSSCSLDLRDHDAGDGPAVFAILLVGFAIVAAALVVEVRYSPPLWVHGAVWLPLIVAASLLSLRVFKSLLIALRYRYRAGDRASAD
jgi:uncharacterized protein (DUF983 family)